MTRLIAKVNRNAPSTEPIVKVTPDSAGWTYTGFEVYRLKPGDRVAFACENRETAVIVLEGTCDVSVDERTFTDVGSRRSVFDDQSPEAVYSPPHRRIEITAKTLAEVAVATAVSEEGEGEARRITPSDIPYEHRGEGVTERHIRHILDEHHPARKLLLVEVVTPAGNWSSFPPHKHDEEIPGEEAYLEETYYYRFDPTNGHAWQRVYDKNTIDEVLTPTDGDVVLVPKGYHPVAAPPGFRTYYLNVMAGHNRKWAYRLDDDFAHIAPRDGNIMGRVEQKK